MVQVLWHLIVKSQIAALMNDCLGQNMDLSTIHFPIRKASLQTLQAFWLLINHVQIHEGEAQATTKAFQLLFNYVPQPKIMQKQGGSLPVTTHPPRSSVIRQMLQKILKAAHCDPKIESLLFYIKIFKHR